MILSQFKAVGHDLFSGGLISTHSGNLSIRMGEHIIINRRGSQLGALEEDDLIETGLVKNDRHTPLASIELAIHRAIYKETQAKAIVHAHPPHAVALSMTEKEIASDCIEGLCELGAVPVVGESIGMKMPALAEVIAKALKKQRVVMIHGHGSYATGQLLEEALRYTSFLEESCTVLCVLKSIKG